MEGKRRTTSIINGITYITHHSPEFDEPNKPLGFGLLLPKGTGDPYVPPVRPKPKYPTGTKYKQWKYFDWDDKPIEGNFEVECEITGTMYFNEDSGWIYTAKPSEEVQVGDNYWNKSMTMEAFTSEKTLDEYFESLK